jgi:FixJ family two-component response regulator
MTTLMKAGAIEFLTKPFRDQDLLDAVNLGLVRDQARRETQQTDRCRHGNHETTVKAHSSNMMRKVKATSPAQLCRMADELKLL